LQSVRPLNLGETLDASIKIVRARWRALATVMLVVAIPIQIATVLITVTTIDDYKAGSETWTGSASTGTTWSDEGTYAAGQVAIIALTFLGYLLGTVACYRAIADTYLGRESGAGDTLRYAGARLGATLWLTIVLVVGLVIAFLALIVPGIWLVVAWSVAYPVMLVEGTGGFAALRRSFKLVEGHWWATAGRLIVAYILVTVFSTVAAFVVLIPGELIVDDTSFGALVVEAGANFVVSLVTTPFMAAIVTLVYFDLRVRKEGFDLALLAERMGGAAAADPAGPAMVPAPTAAAPASSSASEPGRDERDAFGNPVAPRASTPPPAPPPAPAPDLGADAAAPPGWAPPVAPERPAPDE
jgi:Membrane domain of glycerophosphoryl diester phosphodiesterase